jgi:hypothetical protein
VQPSGQAHRLRDLKPLAVALLCALLAACAAPLPSAQGPASASATTSPSPSPTASAVAISCQPYGYTPAPIPFSFAPGPVTSAVAEQTALAFVRSCMQPYSISPTVSTKPATGQQGGPNAGQPVWLVQVDGAVTDSSPTRLYDAHFLIEVNQATGVPTLVAYG